LVAEKLANLEKQFNETNAELQQFKEVLDKLQLMIDRGEKLVSGLAGEKTRW
jgi:septal ring factor EnvC (AmiA/AmiB activator)